MIVKVEIKGERAIISGPPGSDLATFEESATRLRCRFLPCERGDVVGYFDADTTVMGQPPADADPSIQAVTAEVFEIKNRIVPKVLW